MTQLLAAIGATVAALLELSLVPYLQIGDAHPHPVLVFGVIWTIVAGMESGLVWAVVGGVMLDSLAARPLGASVFALVIAVGISVLISRTVIRIRPIAPVIAVPIVSLVYSMILLNLIAAIRPPVSVTDPVAALMPGAAYDAVLGLLFGPLALSIRDRYRPEERVDW
ncbi:MAG: rod shape-determining protein MreD [Chloroflexi bacterium]|nr:rod shape-determining protein MreD [Chloroflexota bacterium]